MHSAGQEGSLVAGLLSDLELAKEIRPCFGEKNCWDFFSNIEDILNLQT